jgi:hypothetical protein
MLEETQNLYPELGTTEPTSLSTIFSHVEAMLLPGSTIESYHVTLAMWEYGGKQMIINSPLLEKLSCQHLTLWETPL